LQLQQRQPKPRGAKQTAMTEVSLNTPEDYALYYLREFGVSVFIIKSDPPADRKKPAVKWDLYKIMRPSQKQLERWFAKNPNYNVAVATGNISNNIIGFDVDGPTAKKELKREGQRCLPT
jgi:hypothetical protein